MSTCAVLLVSQAGCRLSETPQPPLQIDLSEARKPCRHWRLSGGTSHLKEHLDSSDFCHAKDLESPLLHTTFVQTVVLEESMPAENYADQSKQGEQGELRSTWESFDHASDSCMNSVERRNSEDLAENHKLQEQTIHLELCYQVNGEKPEHVLAELSEESSEPCITSEHSESSELSQRDLSENLTLSIPSDMSTLLSPNSSTEQCVLTEDVQTSDLDNSQQMCAIDLGTEGSESTEQLKPPEHLEPPEYNELRGPHTKHPDICEEHECLHEVSLQCEQLNFCEDSLEDPAQQSCGQVSEDACECDYQLSTGSCPPSEHSMASENQMSHVQNDTTADKSMDDFEVCEGNEPFEVGDREEQCVPGEDLVRSSARPQQSERSGEDSECSLVADSQPSEGFAEHCEPSEQCKPCQHLACSYAECRCPSKINTLPEGSQPVQSSPKPEQRAEQDILFCGSMDIFETLWLSQFLIQKKPESLQALEELDCCAHCELPVASPGKVDGNEQMECCEHFVKEEQDASELYGPGLQNSELSDCCSSCKSDGVSEEGSTGCEDPCEQSGVCKIDQECDVHEACVEEYSDGSLESFLDPNIFLEINVEEIISDISTLYEPIEGDSLDSSSEEDYLTCNDRMQYGSETEESFKSCSDEAESDENCSDESDVEKANPFKSEETDAFVHLSMQKMSLMSAYDKIETCHFNVEEHVSSQDDSCEHMTAYEIDQYFKSGNIETGVFGCEGYESSFEEELEGSCPEVEVSHPSCEDDTSAPHIDAEDPEACTGTGDVYGLGLDKDRVAEDEASTSFWTTEHLDKCSDRKIISESGSPKSSVEQCSCSAENACAQSACLLDIICGPLIDVGPCERGEACAEAEKETNETWPVEKGSSDVCSDESHSEESEQKDLDVVLSSQTGFQSADGDIFTEADEPDETNDQSRPHIPYGIEVDVNDGNEAFDASELSQDQIEELEDYANVYTKPCQPEGSSQLIELSRPEHLSADAMIYEESIENCAEQNVENNECGTTHEFFKIADERHNSEASDASEYESDDEELPETCQCDFCLPSIEQVPAKPLLAQVKSKDAGKICVVIDLDETLVHSSFKPVNNADFIIPVEIDGTVHQVYVLKRPHVDEFLKRMGELFECVLFTASLAKDTELLDLIPFFERLSKVDDVYAVLKQHRTTS
ncbi:uncharacterized protein ctdsp1 isoform X2 [Denticeps clupeoides]|uniref:uncharacterized protein ctdsp1 isoform X2 n=1 Tax=Denticeps clupeoides TaxID=299321 RepID=UPI0010A4D1F0|nr:uncharacterized protein LOC114796588 isoform X2 [Denticeps clupeoides]